MTEDRASIIVRGLRRAYGSIMVLRAVDLTVSSGEKVALLGANGAGKTTLLKTLATLLRPTAGTASIGGFDVVHEANEVRRIVGFAGHQPYLYDQLTPAENLTFYGRLYRVDRSDRRIAHLLETVGLRPARGVVAGQLSHGQRQRLALARAILHDPAVLILDEPDTGLDLDGLDILGRVIADRQRTVLFTTHNAGRAEHWASRSIMLANGRLAESETASELARTGHGVRAGLPGPGAIPAGETPAVPGLAR